MCTEDGSQIERLIQASESEAPVVLFGSGMAGSKVKRFFRLKHKKIALVIDNNEAKWGWKLEWGRIVSPEKGTHLYPKGVYVIANTDHAEEMKRQLLQLGIEESGIIVCDDLRKLQVEIEKYLPMIQENKCFILDRPRERTVRAILKTLKARGKSVVYKLMMNIWYPRGTEKKYNVSICAIFRQEAVYLKEWIEYHKIVGVQHFYLYNNFSEDNYNQVLAPYVERGEVTLTEWPVEQGQIAAYRDCVKNFKHESQWIGFIDLDEFIVPIKMNCIPEFLNQFKKRGSVLIYWRLFGSSGKTARDVSNLVTEDFTLCWPKYVDVGKCFFNTDYNLWEDDRNPLIHYIWAEYKGIKYPPVNLFDKVCVDDLNLAGNKEFPIQINHYYTKSFAEYREKLQRGDAVFAKNPRSDGTFFVHDMKCTTFDMCIYKYLILLKQRMGYW